MGTQRTPALSHTSSQKGQQSISSFFGKGVQKATPKPVHQPPPPKQLRDAVRQSDSGKSNELFVSNEEGDFNNGSRRVSNESKRPLDSEVEDDDQPPVKRRRETHEQDTLDPISVFKRPALNAVSGNSNDGGHEPKVTERTSKYLFSSSPIPTAAQNEDIGDEADDKETRKLKERLHQKFVKRLGRPDSIADIKRRNHLIAEETEGNEEGMEDEEGEAEPEPPPSKSKSRKGTAAKKSTSNLTPMEKQVLDIKHKNPDTLLVVEVGYKFRFFGEDARTAARELSIMCIPGKLRFDEHPSEAHIGRFASASVPVHRLSVHVRKLVSAGHKVGVVRQLETAALKAAGTNRNTTFTRGLTNLYTKGTYIDDQEALDGSAGGPEQQGVAPATGHLLCLTETRPRGWGSDEKVQIGLIAVQPSTGDIIYDDFEDGWMRSELETRLLHIAPCEFLIVGDVSKATDKLVQHLSGSKTNVFGDRARVERVNKPKTMAAESYRHITNFYASKVGSDAPSSSQVESSQETGTLLDKVHKLSENATVCLSAMITHLTDYGLQHVFDLTKYFQSFSARSHMLLNGNTLTSLEVYRNQTDYSESGSLFWTLDRTQTRFGQRLLRKWVGRPLLDRVRLDERVTAVEELRDSGSTANVDRIKQLLGKTRSDLERSLIRIYYGKCTRPELFGVLQTLQVIAQEYAHVNSPSEAGFESTMLNEAIASLPKIADDVVQYLERINTQAAKDDDKHSFFRQEHETEDITDHKMGIIAVEHDLEEFKKVAAEKVRKKNVDYVTVAGIDFLIELDNTQVKNVPASWAKISATKRVSRFHAPEVVAYLRERDQHKEALAAACDAAFKALLAEISSKYQAFRDCVQSLAVLDCLLSLAEVATQPGYCKPEFNDTIGIDIQGGRHPMVEQLLLDSFVPNDIHLSSDSTRALLVTGPNMGGKSSYVRSVALIAIMAQIGSYVPADSARLGLLDAVFTRMGAFDNMMKGESTFMVELSETSDILKQASPRSLVILDELGRGTSTHDGVAIAQAVLQYMVSSLRSLTLFITHYQSLARVAELFPAGELRNVHMKFTEQEDSGQGEMNITFLYEVGEGVAHRSYGLNVARLAGLPRALLEAAGAKSGEMEEKEGRRRLGYLSKVIGKVVEGGLVEELEHAVAGIEQL
ncbi:Mismatch repair protein msh3 [Meristemomyces frigidus]|uniref:DNA mismatch repair protein MSH3 n=1 Tax=Meristemomyces frigidus TaxID=1508187 RepID=A0AAN7TNL0_9PEZI|nr:Mismatch repair protein msh3 [Meristemomyces frigidus]